MDDESDEPAQSAHAAAARRGDPAESAEIARALLLCYRDGQFTCQTFFTQPLLGQINWLEGLKQDAHVYFREITAIGIDLFHIRLVGKEEDVRKMCGVPSFYGLLRGIEATLTEDTRSRWYLDIASGKEHWDAIVDVPQKAFHLANHVNVRKTRTRIDNIIVVGDRLLGLTAKREVVIGKLTPDVIEREKVMLEMEPVENVNKLGKIDALARLPNSDEVFLVTVQNRVYHFDLWGTMTSFEELPESVSCHSAGTGRTASPELSAGCLAKARNGLVQRSLTVHSFYTASVLGRPTVTCGSVTGDRLWRCLGMAGADPIVHPGCRARNAHSGDTSVPERAGPNHRDRGSGTR